MFKVIVFSALVAIVACASLTDKVVVPDIKVTNNTQVPSIIYTLDAVQSLQAAVQYFSAPSQIAQAYAELFSAKHPEKQWAVAYGYTAVYAPNISVYVETQLSTGKNLQSDKGKGNLVLIYNIN